MGSDWKNLVTELKHAILILAAKSYFFWSFDYAAG